MRREIARAPAAAAAQPLLDAGGKRLRARVLFWSARATATAPLDPEDERLVGAAAAIEFAHLGSLIHDDIVDGGDTRRGIATVHHRHGVRVATDAGAALAHLASELVARLGRPVRRAVRRTIFATCRGQLRELATAFLLLTPHARWRIMQEKTAAFFALAAELGARVAAAPPAHRAAACRFARRFGVAFQIADDVLDLAGDPRELGRANGADLREGVVTLPVLLAADPDGALARAMAHVRGGPDSETIATCARLIDRGGGIAAATFLAGWWYERALRALAVLPPGPAVAELRALARTAVRRGLRPGPPRFTIAERRSPPSWRPPAPGETTRIGQRAAGAPLAPRLAALLDWFHPGLATLAAERGAAHGIRARWEELRRPLLADDPRSAAARVAADAIALAWALADESSLWADAAATLALVDALHCAAIGLLSGDAPEQEHAAVAARARALTAPHAAPPGASVVPIRALNPMSLASGA